MTWTQGRQGTGYEKRLLVQGRAWDVYLLRYPEGSSVPEHVDVFPGQAHYRLNVVLKRAKAGGEFRCSRPIFSRWRINLFRSDYPHEVTRIEQGDRLVLSLGWVRHEP